MTSEVSMSHVRRLSVAVVVSATWIAGPLPAQGVEWSARAAAGQCSEGSPVTGESCGLTSVGLEARVRRHVVIGTGVEWSTSHVDGTILPCLFVPPPGVCFVRPSTEHVSAATLGVRLQGNPDRFWVPYASVGVAWQRSREAGNPGERWTWLSRQAALGFELGVPGFAVLVEARLRELPRWTIGSSGGPINQRAVLAGLRWRFHKPDRAGR